MAAFQRAYADLAASPSLCLAARADPAAAFAPYALSPREQARLAGAVWQRGMDANCSLYRVTRVTALNSVAPLTLRVLRPGLRELLEAYWAAHDLHELRFARETARFLAWMAANPDRLPAPAAALLDLVRLELALEEARLGAPAAGAEPVVVALTLQYDAAALIAAAQSEPPSLAAVPEQRCALLVTTDERGAAQLLRADSRDA